MVQGNKIINSVGFNFELTEQGEWLSKGVPFKKYQGNIAETSPFKITDSIENNYKKQFDRCLVSFVKDISMYLK